jgi:predicted secreted protein
MNKFFLAFAVFISVQALAVSNVHLVRALGTSAKGQFIAIEEYGHNPGMKTTYSRIKFMNMWNKNQHGPVVEIEEAGSSDKDLSKVRSKARGEAAQYFEKYKINLSI